MSNSNQNNSGPAKLPRYIVTGVGIYVVLTGGYVTTTAYDQWLRWHDLALNQGAGFMMAFGAVVMIFGVATCIAAWLGYENPTKPN